MEVENLHLAHQWNVCRTFSWFRYKVFFKGNIYIVFNFKPFPKKINEKYGDEEFKYIKKCIIDLGKKLKHENDMFRYFNAIS